MRKVTVFALLITGAALLALLPAVTIGQPGGGKKGGGGFGGGGFGGGPNPAQDPDQVFEMLAKGRTFISLADLGRSKMAGPLNQYAQDNGISNGQITRQQFKDFFAYANSKAGMGAAPAGPGGGGFPGGGGGFPGGKKKGGGPGGEGMPGGMPAGGFDPDTINKWADDDFKRKDKNEDGKLNTEEMPPPLRANLAKWDKNNDGLIDLYEYRAYFLARIQGSEDASYQGNKGGIASIIIDDEELDRKPVVYRVGGKMPPGLPDWFVKLDTDKDGQVALYEWRVSGKDMDGFKKWDLNDDGFITAEEAAKVQSLVAKDTPKDSLASNGYGGSEDRSPGMGKGGFGKGNGGGGDNPFSKGKGGKGKGGKGKGDN